MPYKLIKQDGKTCVAKESTGKAIPGGCHSDPAKAKAHMRAMYAAEGREKKELTDEQEEMITKEITEKCYAEAWIPWNIKSFSELEAWRKSQEQAQEIHETTHDFQAMVGNIMSDSEVPNKIKALETLVGELATHIKSDVAEINEPEDKGLKASNKNLGNTVKEWLMEVFGLEAKTKELPNDLMFWKEADGSWRWMARYSNKFRDRDNPPEIISAKSHQKFVEKVDKGIAAYPELWLWHRPEYKWGKANWVGYDDAGFALAMGNVDKGREPIAEAMSKIDPKEIRVSHGMPKRTIVRDPDDPTIIVEHETVEISPLPKWAAANLLTSFTILSKEDNMAIPKEKRQELIDEWGIPAAVLDSLEKQNEAQAKEASDAGIQSKEAATVAAPQAPETPVTAVPPESAPAPVQTKDETPLTPPATQAPTATEIADAVSAVLNERLTAIDARFTAIETAVAQIPAIQAEVKALKETDEVKIKDAVAKTPAASLMTLLAKNVHSIVGASETAVDGRSTLAKDKPKETAAPPPDRPGNFVFGMIDQIIKESEQPAST